MTRERRGRGRPALFDGPTQDRYLAAVADGMYLNAAADHIGIHRNVPTRLARTDAVFGARLDDAKAAGRKRRIDNLPHDESRYCNYKCRCPQCTTAATTARTARRAQDTPPEQEEHGGESGTIHDLIPGAGTVVGESVSSLLLLRAS